MSNRKPTRADKKLLNELAEAFFSSPLEIQRKVLAAMLENARRSECGKSKDFWTRLHDTFKKETERGAND